jgi:hypothetical protein
MKYCPTCSKELADNARTCVSCGHHFFVPQWWHPLVLALAGGALFSVINDICETTIGVSFKKWMPLIGGIFFVASNSFFSAIKTRYAAPPQQTAATGSTDSLLKDRPTAPEERA